MRGALDTLRSRIDLLDLVKDYVRDLRRSGKSWVALCPFHEERTPSFHIDQDRGLFYCFGCHKGGDAIRFYMEMENFGFREAVEALCERFGVPKPRQWSGSQGGDSTFNAQQKQRVEIQRALNLAAALYAKALWDPKTGVREGEAAVRYLLNERHLTRKAAEDYGLGYAPQGPNWLFTQLVSKHGFDPRILEKAGLAVMSSRDARYVDFFRERILFPVWDLKGNICAFGGRWFSGVDQKPAAGSPPGFGFQAAGKAGGPKYLNSQDSDFFKKSEILYGFHQHKAAIRSQDKAYIVEGYFDVLALAQAGIPLAVSPMGGAFTVQQARILKRLTSRATLIFDPDTAGTTAAIRTGRIFLSLGIAARVISLPSGLDPDEFVVKYGKKAFEDLERDGSQSLLDFEMTSRLGGQNISKLNLENRQRLARDMLPSLGAISSDIERDDAIISVAQKLRISDTGLRKELGRFLENPGFTVAPGGVAKSDTMTVGQILLTFEEALLGMAIQDRNCVRKTLESHGIGTSDFDEPRIASYIFTKETPGDGDSSDASWQELLSRVALIGTDDSDTNEFSQRLECYAKEIRRRTLVRELKSLREQIRQQREKNQGCAKELLTRFQEISKSLKSQGAFEEV